MKTCQPRRGIAAALSAGVLVGCASDPFSSPSDDPSPVRSMASWTDTYPSHDRDASPPVLGPKTSLADYQLYAATNNPGLEAAFQRWRVAMERIPQVGALPDSRLSYGYYLSEVETRVGPMQHSFGLSQTFPWFGSLERRETAAAEAARAELIRLEGERLALSQEVEAAYNELYLLDRSTYIARENIELLRQFERVARTRYRVGTAQHPNVIRIQVELARLEDRLVQLQAMVAPAAARLNASLGRPMDAPLAVPAGLNPNIVEADLDDLMVLLQRHNPTLAALDAETERARLDTDVARMDGRPDLTVGLAYTVIDERDGLTIPENGDDALLATVSVSLPIWREKYDARVRQATAHRLANASRRLDTANRLAAELRQALFEHQDARRRLELHRDTLIPKATESLRASLAGFEQGNTDFLDLIDTERTLLEFQLAVERAAVDLANSRAHLERLTGVRLGAEPPEEMETTP